MFSKVSSLMGAVKLAAAAAIFAVAGTAASATTVTIGSYEAGSLLNTIDGDWSANPGGASFTGDDLPATTTAEATLNLIFTGATFVGNITYNATPTFTSFLVPGEFAYDDVADTFIGVFGPGSTVSPTNFVIVTIENLTDPGRGQMNVFVANEISAIPLPAGGLLLLAGLGGLAVVRRRKAAA